MLKRRRVWGGSVEAQKTGQGPCEWGKRGGMTLPRATNSTTLLLASMLVSETLQTPLERHLPRVGRRAAF